MNCRILLQHISQVDGHLVLLVAEHIRVFKLPAVSIRSDMQPNYRAQLPKHHLRRDNCREFLVYPLVQEYGSQDVDHNLVYDGVRVDHPLDVYVRGCLKQMEELSK